MTGWLIVTAAWTLVAYGIFADVRRFRRENKKRCGCDMCGTRAELLSRSRYHHDEGVPLMLCASCEEAA